MKVRKADDGRLLFYCPGCKQYHAFDDRWTFNGDYEKPTFSPSLLIRAPYMENVENYRCHSFVREGKIQFLSDCTHDLAGQTVKMESEE
jgi:hypothetical protein